MTKLILAMLVAVSLVVVASGCHSSSSGSREYVPGKGWVPND